MSSQTLNTLRIATPYVLIVAAFISYLIKRHYEKLDAKVEKLDKDFHELKEELPKEYVLKDDNIIAMARLDRGVRDIDLKVDKLLKRGE